MSKIRLPRLDPNSYYHSILVKQYGVEGARMMLWQTKNAWFGFNTEQYKKAKRKKESAQADADNYQDADPNLGIETSPEA